MDRFTEMLRIILPVLLMLLLGMLCRIKRLISREGLEALKTVAVQIGLPAVLLHTFAVTEYTPSALLLRLLCPGENLTRALCLMFLLPPPFVLPVFAREDGQRAYLSSVLSVNTLVTMAGFIALAAAGL